MQKRERKALVLLSGDRLELAERNGRGTIAAGLQSINPLTTNDPYRGRTAPLTSKVAFHIFIQQI